MRRLRNSAPGPLPLVGSRCARRPSGGCATGTRAPLRRPGRAATARPQGRARRRRGGGWRAARGSACGRRGGGEREGEGEGGHRFMSTVPGGPWAAGPGGHPVPAGAAPLAAPTRAREGPCDRHPPPCPPPPPPHGPPRHRVCPASPPPPPIRQGGCGHGTPLRCGAPALASSPELTPPPRPRQARPPAMYQCGACSAPPEHEPAPGRSHSPVLRPYRGPGRRATQAPPTQNAGRSQQMWHKGGRRG